MYKNKGIMHSIETKKDKRIDGKRVNFWSMDVQLLTYRVKWEMRLASFHPAKGREFHQNGSCQRKPT